jgi:hypothetical protein
LLSLVGVVTRIFTLQGKLYEAEMEAERKREELAEKKFKEFFQG